MKLNYAINANRLFLLSIVVSQIAVYILWGFGVRDVMINQFLIEVFMTCPCVYYLMLQREPLRSSIGLKGLHGIQWLFLIPLAVCVDKIAEFINVVSQLFTPNVIGSHMAELVLAYPLPVAFFVIAVMPAVCEELIYRGVLYRNYRKSSVWGAVVLTAVLFGMMHMNLNQFSYAFVLGFLFAIINEITGSILPSMLLHFYINGRSVLVLYSAVNYLTKLREQYSAAETAGNAELMEELLYKAQGVPINRRDWLTEYMSMGEGTVTETMVALLPGFCIALAVTAVCIFLLHKNNKATGRNCALFCGREGTGERTGFCNLCSPSLIAGVLICVFFMLASG